MKKYAVFISVILLFLPLQMDAQTPTDPQNKNVDAPWVPRVSAYEAYVKYKQAKAIILHGGGEAYNKRHIMGALNLD